MIPSRDHFPQIHPELQALLEGEGLALFGVTDVHETPDAADAEREYGGWIESDMHGSMEYLARHTKLKYAPEKVLAGCRSLIMIGANYYQEAHTDLTEGRVARYAWGRDYHNALGKRLKRVVRALREQNPEEQFRSFVDASPLSERYFAERAGLGYTARNTLTISSAFGSWFFLAEILSTRRYEPTPVTEPVHGGCPSSCFRCGDVCPTGALFAHGRMDARRCISYLTIEHRGSIDEELRPRMGTWVFGCDLCQEVCPLNVRARPTTLEDFTHHRAGPQIPLERLLAFKDQREYRDAFAGTPLLRPGRDAMVRNACIAAANGTRTDLLPRLRKLCNDSSALVREHARWAASKLD